MDVDRTLLIHHAQLELCLSQKQFDSYLKRIDAKACRWLTNKYSLATTHRFYDVGKDKTISICVCLKTKNRSTSEIIVSLAHECVHIWQHEQEYIGERFPSEEFQAYSIENLLRSYLTAYQQLSQNAITQRPKRKSRKSSA